MKPYICHFPTTTVFIDDKQEFLDSISLKLDHTTHSYEFFSNALEAIKYIKNNYEKSKWYYDYIKTQIDENEDLKVVEFNIHDIYKQVYNNNRFSIITSVVIDYDMPERDGLYVAQELQNLNISRILLTGAGDEKLAVNAFNKKLIDAFISKSSKTIYQELKNVISEASKSYFKDISQKIFDPLILGENNLIDKNTTFLQLFSSIISEKNIVEFYMTEIHSSYLLFNKDGKVDQLLFRSSNYLDEIYQFVKNENIPNIILQQLQSKNKMLNYTSFSKESIPTFTDIEKHLLDTKHIILDNVDYYYGYKNDVLDDSKIISFLQYLNMRHKKNESFITK